MSPHRARRQAWPAFTLKTAPTFEPALVPELRDHLRLTTDTEDVLLQGYITAARQWVEAYTGRALATQTWQLAMPEFAESLWLPRAAPLQSVTFVKYYDAANTLTVWTSSQYTVPAFHEPAVINRAYGVTFPTVYDRDDAVQVEYVTGYASGACPEALRLAVITLASHFYEHREPVLVGTISKEVEFAVTALCAPYRVFWRPPVWP